MTETHCARRPMGNPSVPNATGMNMSPASDVTVNKLGEHQRTVDDVRVRTAKVAAVLTAGLTFIGPTRLFAAASVMSLVVMRDRRAPVPGHLFKETSLRPRSVD